MMLRPECFKLLVGVVLFFSSMQSYAEDKMYGVFMVVKGDVRVQTTADQAINKARVGDKVYEGDRIMTGLDSRARIVMADRNVLNLTPDTKMKIEVYNNDPASDKKNVDIRLLSGKVRANVEQKYDGKDSKFQIRTPTAVAGVRGTQFQASFDPKSGISSIVTFKGAVAVTAVNARGQAMGRAVLVKRGQMTTTSRESRAAEAPRSVPAEEMNHIESDSVDASASTSASEGTSDSAQAEASSSNREVASEVAPAAEGAAPSMIDSKDMDLGIAKEIISSGPDINVAPVVAPPRAPTSDPVKEVIRSGQKNKVIIRPNPR